MKNYMEYLDSQIRDANHKFIEAMKNDDYEAACVYGEIAARLEEIAYRVEPT